MAVAVGFYDRQKIYLATNTFARDLRVVPKRS